MNLNFSHHYLLMVGVLTEQGRAMEQLQWQDSYSVGNETLDNQHKKLVGMINHMIVNCDQPVDSFVVSDFLNEMINYANEHFKCEEEYMEVIGFDELDTHKLEHKQFEVQACKFCDGVLNHQQQITYDILGFLVNWLKDHILTSDMKYKIFDMK